MRAHVDKGCVLRAKICKFHAIGACTRGEQCAFAHGGLVRTKLCKFYMVGACTRGEECQFAHGYSDLRIQPDLYRTRICPLLLNPDGCRKGSACKYAHTNKQIRKPVCISTPSSHVLLRQTDGLMPGAEQVDDAVANFRIQPDLCGTRICPLLLSPGGCLEGSACKYAHTSEQIREPKSISTSSSRVLLGRANCITPGAAQVDDAAVMMMKGGNCQPSVLERAQPYPDDLVGVIVPESFEELFRTIIGCVSSKRTRGNVVQIYGDKNVKPRPEYGEWTQDNGKESESVDVVESLANSHEPSPRLISNENFERFSVENKLPRNDEVLRLSPSNWLSLEAMPKRPGRWRNARSLSSVEAPQETKSNSSGKAT